jgi:hypothetical protein
MRSGGREPDAPALENTARIRAFRAVIGDAVAATRRQFESQP